jgi:hypothetical protein
MLQHLTAPVLLFLWIGDVTEMAPRRNIGDVHFYKRGYNLLGSCNTFATYVGEER